MRCHSPTKTGVLRFYSILTEKRCHGRQVLSYNQHPAQELCGNIIAPNWLNEERTIFVQRNTLMTPTIASILNFAGPDMIVILLIVLLLFGSKKLPELARGMGRAVKEFGAARDEIEKGLSQSGPSGVSPAKLMDATNREVPPA